MKNQRRFFIGLILALLVIIFALINSQAVTVNFFGMQIQCPLIILIVVTLLIGAGITLLLSASSIATAKKTTRRLQDELSKLRNQPKQARDVIEEDTSSKK